MVYIFFKFQIPVVHCWYIGRQLTFVYYSYILWSCYIYSIVVEFFCQFFWDFLCDNHVICKKKKLFPSFPSFILLIFLSYCTKSSGTKFSRRGERWGYSCLIPSLRGKVSFLTIKCSIRCRFSVDILMLEKFLFIPSLLRILSRISSGFHQVLFCIHSYDDVIFLL